MPAKTTEPVEFLICNASFVGFYDGEGYRQFVAHKGQTIIEATSVEAKLWGRAVDADGSPLFKPLTPSFIAAKTMIDPYFAIEQATAGPGERRGD